MIDVEHFVVFQIDKLLWSRYYGNLMADNKKLDFANCVDSVIKEHHKKPGVLRQNDENCMPHLSLCPLFFFGAGNADIVDFCNKIMGVPPFVETTKPNSTCGSWDFGFEFNFSL
ncbi:unnamed protein product [Caenorhabditis angaria]|uniref:Uncharacterized protein n=1 Tax=Caenorhabditis angaria TaxID=860376 RepID=A0A9P1IK29_9PELO|nr:unnamed protein product [Caenorhabditis angaria]